MSKKILQLNFVNWLVYSWAVDSHWIGAGFISAEYEKIVFRLIHLFKTKV